MSILGSGWSRNKHREGEREGPGSQWARKERESGECGRAGKLDAARELRMRVEEMKRSSRGQRKKADR